MTRVSFAARLLFVSVVSLGSVGFVAVPRAAEQTWTGQISDSLCGVKHEEAAEGQGKMPDRDCTLACVRGGSKFVLVADGKVLPIANQDLADLTTHAGHKVKVTGELKNGEIVVAKIELAPTP
jgi:hypothetical protein